MSPGVKSSFRNWFCKNYNKMAAILCLTHSFLELSSELKEKKRLKTEDELAPAHHTIFNWHHLYLLLKLGLERTGS